LIPKIIDRVNVKKSKHSITKDSFNLFFDVIDIMEINKSDYFENNIEFQNGSIHQEIDRGNFSWLYNKKCL
jgi:hypothetical protein